MNTNDFRKPTNQERKIINKFMLLKRKDTIKLCKIMIFIFTFLTLLMFVGSFGDFNLSAISLTIIFLALLILFLIPYLKAKNEIKSINDFIILVLECTIYKIETNPDTLGCCNVKIRNKNGEGIKGWFRARIENVNIGDKCLLVCKKHPMNVKKDSFVIFTDFMLSEEGLKMRNWGDL